MKKNNAIFAQGAYNWACSEAQHYGIELELCTVDLESTLRSISSNTGFDVKISIFESPIKPENEDVILMLEWVEIKKEKINFYMIEKENYRTMKENYGAIIDIFKMNGRIRYMEELNAGRAVPPMFLIDS